MNLLEVLDKNDEKMREIKEEWVVANPETPEMPIHIHFWRGEEHVACILTPLNGSQAIKVASLGAVRVQRHHHGVDVRVLGDHVEELATDRQGLAAGRDELHRPDLSGRRSRRDG